MTNNFPDNIRLIGQQTRREVMGQAHAVDVQEIPDKWDDLKSLIDEVAWGRVWNRNIISRRERSLITLSMLIALDRPVELVAHARGARNNGCTQEEIIEVIIHSLIYCGAPAATTAMRAINTFFEEDTAGINDQKQ